VATSSINKPVGSDYPTAGAWAAWAAIQSDAQTGVCYHDGTSGDCGAINSVVIWTNPNALRLTCDPASRHATASDTTAAWDAAGVAYLNGGISLQSVTPTDFHVDNMAICSDGTNHTVALGRTSTGNTIEFRDCLIVSRAVNNTLSAIQVLGAAGTGAAATFTNCAVFRMAVNAGVAVDAVGYGAVATITLHDTTIDQPQANGTAVRAQYGGAIDATGTVTVGPAGMTCYASIGGASITCDHCLDVDNTAATVGGDTDSQYDSGAYNTLLVTNGADWHCNPGQANAGTGVAIPGITTDIDGDTRADPPYIGCDEIPAAAGGIPWPLLGSGHMMGGV